ncbi:MAG: polysaccharide biosynthesis protein [Gammaproteobacteria bacterium]|nr:polysaccharide biosynthesis protein [Gammaproteobacteria bacterium]
MNELLLRLSVLPRRIKQLVLLVADAVAMPCLFLFVYAVRLDDFSILALTKIELYPILISILCITVFVCCGIYRAVIRAFDESFLHDLILAVLIIVMMLLALSISNIVFIPHSVPFFFGFLIFLWVWSTRSLIRWVVRKTFNIEAGCRRVAIYGAGSAGRQLLAAIRASHEYHAVVFFDDSPSLMYTTVIGLRVYSGCDFESVYHKFNLDEVLIALPSASKSRQREVVELLEPFKIPVRTLPGLMDLVGGQVSISDIREIDIVDLLGRDLVPPIRELLLKNIQDKTVLVTGAGGSIGSELCRQIVKLHPKTLILLEQSEYALYQIEQELKATSEVPLVVIMGSVLKEHRLKSIMQEYDVKTVYHAAAYKHVPLVEVNPFEGIINNTIGTARCAKAALEAKVETFVLISTDKAVRPTNIMGATKRLAELVCQAYATISGSDTQFSMVRFGNVLGSSGSVIPLFKKQLAKGGPLTVTDPEMTRYFMTIPEAAQLVLQAGAMGTGGDVFLLDMGEPVKIVDLAKKMILLSGLSIHDTHHSGDIEIQFTGLRPGEKLYEELLIDAAIVEKTAHTLIMRSKEKYFSMAEIDEMLEIMLEASRDHDVDKALAQIEKFVDGYKRSQIYS